MEPLIPLSKYLKDHLRRGLQDQPTCGSSKMERWQGEGKKGGRKEGKDREKVKGEEEKGEE